MSYYIAELNKYVTEQEAIEYARKKRGEKTLDEFKAEIIAELLTKLENDYVISFDFKLPSGQVIKVDAKLSKVVKTT